jgi:hypothetical protein
MLIQFSKIYEKFSRCFQRRKYSIADYNCSFSVFIPIIPLGRNSRKATKITNLKESESDEKTINIFEYSTPYEIETDNRLRDTELFGSFDNPTWGEGRSQESDVTFNSGGFFVGSQLCCFCRFESFCFLI